MPVDTGVEEADDGTISAQTWLAIGAMALAIFAIANDFTAMNVVLPTLEQDLDTDLAKVQWVVNGYSIIFGVLIVPGGRLADLFGRKEMLALGAVIFALFSFLGGLAPNVELLIAARILMGIGGALMWPSILGLMYALLPASKSGLAGGLVIGVAGIGNAAGPVIAGALAEVNWRFIFMLNLPIAAIAIAATWKFVHIDTERQRAKIDVVGSVLLAIGLFALLTALTVAPADGYTAPVVLGGFVVFAVMMVAFVMRERAAGEDGLVPPSVVGNKPFRWACLSVLAMAAVFFGTLFYLPQFFEKVLQEGTLTSGVMLLPFVGVFATASFSQNWLVGRIGAKAVISLGAICLCLGPTLFVLVLDQSSGYSAFVPGMVVLGIGVGLFYSAVTTAALTSVDPDRSSLAGGLLYMFQIAGGAVGLALTTTVFLAASSSEIDESAQEIGVELSSSELVDIQGVLIGTETSQQLASSDPGQAAQLTEIVRDAFISGMRWAFGFDAALTAIGLAIALFAVGGPISRIGRDRPGRDDGGVESPPTHRHHRLSLHRHRHTP